MSLAPGTRLGPYEILALLGAGGMGEVYREKDVRVDRLVALKVLPEEFLEGEDRRQRFEREARMLASLNHPGIAVLYSFEEIPSSSSLPSSSRHVLVMELVEGGSLEQKIASGRFKAALEKGDALRGLEVSPDDEKFVKGFGLLTRKPLLVILNAGEADAGDLAGAIARAGLGRWKGKPHVAFSAVSATIEQEISWRPAPSRPARRTARSASRARTTS